MQSLDLTNYSYGLSLPSPHILNVGWLGLGGDFAKGDVPPCFLKKLAALILREAVDQTRGCHYCDFCDAEHVIVHPDGGSSILRQPDMESGLWKRLFLDKKSTVLGSAEVWVPAPDGSVIFGAPNLIHHYVAAHRYLPPAAFIDAVNAFDPASDWSGIKALADARQISA